MAHINPAMIPVQHAFHLVLLVPLKLPASPAIQFSLTFSTVSVWVPALLLTTQMATVVLTAVLLPFMRIT